MTRRIDRAVIMCLILVNITLIALIAIQGQRIDKALRRVEAIAEQETHAPEDALLAAAKGQAFNAVAELSDAKEAAKPQEPEKSAGAPRGLPNSAPKAQAAKVCRNDLSGHAPDKSIKSFGAPAWPATWGENGAISAAMPQAAGVRRDDSRQLDCWESNKSSGAPAENQQSVFRGEQAFTAYAYCACEKCCGEWAEYGKTASGTTPEQGRTVAVDPEVIPLGSSVWIDGEGPYVAEDTGSGISGDTIDIFFASHQDALNWGKRQVQVMWEEKP